MKKILAFALATLMILAMFAGCASKTDGAAESAAASPAESAATESAAAESTPAETASEAVESMTQAAAGWDQWNGKTEVWSVLPTTNAEGLVMINDAMGAMCEANGWTYVKKDAEVDPSKQVTFIEDAVASGTVGAIMCAAMSVEMLQSCVEEATKAGIIVVYLGAEPTAYTIGSCVYTAYELTGMKAVEMAEAWAKTSGAKADDTGKVPVALDTYDDIVDGRYRSNAFRDRTAESDTLYAKYEATNYGEDAQNKAYSWAEDCLTATPDLRIFVCYEPDAAYGVCYYLEQYTADNGLDLKDFCVIWCYEDSESPNYLAKAKEDPSSTAAKGYVTYGGTPFQTGAILGMEILALAYGDSDNWPKGLEETYAAVPQLEGEHPDHVTWEYGTPYYDQINAWAQFGDYNYDGDAFYHWEMGMENPATKYKY